MQLIAQQTQHKAPAPPPVAPNSNKVGDRLKGLRVRHAQASLDWFHAPGLGKQAIQRRACKAYYRYLAGFMLKPDWEGCIGTLPYATAAKLLRQHNDFPRTRNELAQTRWISEIVKLVCKAPNVTRLSPRLILFDTLLEDHGGLPAIEAHHKKAAKSRRKSNAKSSRTSRANALYRKSQALAQNVSIEQSYPLTPKTPPPYNPQSRPQPPNNPPSCFAATRPKRPKGVSANRDPKPKQAQPLASIRPQRGKTKDVPAIPAWLRADAANPYFDPRSNPKAARIYAHGPLDESFVRMLKRVHPELATLSFLALKRRGATNDTLLAACHLLTRASGITNPSGWVMSSEQRLRDGGLRYAG